MKKKTIWFFAIVIFHQLQPEVQSFAKEYNQAPPATSVLLPRQSSFCVSLFLSLENHKEKVSTGFAILMEPGVYGDL